MTTDITEMGFTNLLAAHLSRMPVLAQVINRTDQALLCRTKGGQTFMVLVTGPGEERPQTADQRPQTEDGEQKTEDRRQKAAGILPTEDGKVKKVAA